MRFLGHRYQGPSEYVTQLILCNKQSNYGFCTRRVEIRTIAIFSMKIDDLVFLEDGQISSPLSKIIVLFWLKSFYVDHFFNE